MASHRRPLPCVTSPPAGRHAAGYALHAPGDAPKPAGADGGRGIEPAGGALTAKQRQVRPASHRRTLRPGVG